MTAWLRSPVAWVDDGDRVVIVCLRAPLGPARLLTGSAAIIWRALDDNELRSVETITATVAGDADIDPEHIVDDITTFLVSLRSDGLAVAPSMEEGDE